MEYLNRLNEKRLNLVGEARSILTSAQDEKRELSTEEEARWSAINSEVDALTAKIDDVKASEQRFAAAEAYRAQVEPVVHAEMKKPDADSRAILRQIVSGELRSHDFEVRALATGTATVPVTFADFVAQTLYTANPVYQAALAGGGVIETATGDTIRIPTWSDQSSALVAEAGTASSSDPTIASVQLGAFKLTTLQRLSAEVATDNVINLESLIGVAAGRSLAYLAGSYFTLGTGTVEPRGFVSQLSAANTAVGSAFFNVSDLMTIYYALPAQNRANSVWMVSNGAIAKLRKATTTDGAFLWQPSLVAGQPDAFMGRPIYENPHMAAVASASKSVAVYDPAEFKIRVVGGVQVARSSDVYFTSDEIAIRSSWRVDSAFPITGAGKVLTSANS